MKALMLGIELDTFFDHQIPQRKCNSIMRIVANWLECSRNVSQKTYTLQLNFQISTKLYSTTWSQYGDMHQLQNGCHFHDNRQMDTRECVQVEYYAMPREVSAPYDNS